MSVIVLQQPRRGGEGRCPACGGIHVDIRSILTTSREISYEREIRPICCTCRSGIGGRGRIPHYARSAEMNLDATVFYYKEPGLDENEREATPR